MSENKIVLVEIEEVGAAAPNLNSELQLDMSDAQLSDQMRVLNAIKLKKPQMHDQLSRGKVLFRIESNIFAGKYVDVGEDSPIKDLSVLKCLVTRPIPIHLDNLDEKEATDEPSSVMSLEENGVSYVEDKQQTTNQVRNANVKSCKRKSSRKEANAVLTSGIPEKVFIRSTYSLPSFFSQAVEIKLKKGKAFHFNDYSSIARDLGKSIQQHSTTNKLINIRYVVSKLVSEYPHILGQEEESRPDVENLICQKISAYLGRKRREIGIKKSIQGGRPTLAKNTKICDGRARRTTVGEVEVDVVSYKENVAKMLDLFSNSNGNITQALIVLWKETFTGRRKQFEDCILSTVVQDVLKDVCPLLKFQPFLNEEFEGILGIGTVARTLENWKKFVPEMIKLAKTSNNKSVKSILAFYADLSDLEQMSCASLELLPELILVGRRKKNVNLYFIDCREVCLYYFMIKRNVIQSKIISILRFGRYVSGFHGARQTSTLSVEVRRFFSCYCWQGTISLCVRLDGSTDDLNRRLLCICSRMV